MKRIAQHRCAGAHLPYELTKWVQRRNRMGGRKFNEPLDAVVEKRINTNE
jgi:hypothetical protein